MKKYAVAAVAALLMSAAQAWQPTRPVEVLIGHAPGSGNELVFRALAAEVEKNTGAKFAVVIKPGLGGVLATKDLVDKAADGHSISMVTSIGAPVTDQINASNAAVRGYGIDDFTYLQLSALNQFAIIANLNDSIKTPRDLIKSLNTEPVTFSAGGGARLVFEVLKDSTNFKDVVWLDARGPVQAATEIMGGHVRLAVVPSLIAHSMHAQGQVRIVATTGPARIKYLPNIPTVSEVLPGFDVNTGWGIVAPKGLPKDVQEWYVREFTRALNSDSVKAFYAANMIEAPPAAVQTPAGFRKYTVEQQEKYAKIVEKIVKEINQKK